MLTAKFAGLSTLAVLVLLTSSVWTSAATAAEQIIYELKDHHGIPVLRLENVKVFHHSDYFGRDIPYFEAAVKNIAGAPLPHSLDLVVKIHRKNGSVATFDFHMDEVLNSSQWFLLNRGTPVTISRQGLVDLYAPEEVQSVEITIPENWQSPEDARLEDEERERNSAKLQAMQQREKEKVAALCRGIYNRTANKRVADLTVREEQQVKSCQALGLYSR